MINHLEPRHYFLETAYPDLGAFTVAWAEYVIAHKTAYRGAPIYALAKIGGELCELIRVSDALGWQVLSSATGSAGSSAPPPLASGAATETAQVAQLALLETLATTYDNVRHTLVALNKTFELAVGAAHAVTWRVLPVDHTAPNPGDYATITMPDDTNNPVALEYFVGEADAVEFSSVNADAITFVATQCRIRVMWRN